MNLKNIWGGNVGFKGVILVALVSLVVGLGISGSLDWLSPSRAVNLMGESGNPEFRELLEKLGGDSDAKVRAMAEKSKGKLRMDDPVAAPEQPLESPGK